jgi:DinB family protein
MAKSVRWFDRTFEFDLPLTEFPAIVERLARTPKRAADLVAGVAEELLSIRCDQKWSAKENLAHLVDLHSLDEQRLKDYLAGAEVLSVADLTNSRTETAGHNLVPIALVLDSLNKARLELTRDLRALSEKDLARTALHPRLSQPMRLLDWAYFVAEHDHHHLEKTRQAIIDAQD